MERRIKDSCGVGTIDPRIEDGHYELIGPDEEIILPRDWEEMIEPGWVITIRMLPMPSALNTPAEKPGLVGQRARPRPFSRPGRPDTPRYTYYRVR